MIKVLIIILGLYLWPINLIANNEIGHSVNYFGPTVLIGLSFFIFKRWGSFYLYPLMVIPLIEPKLAALPLIAGLLDIFWSRRWLSSLLFLCLALVILAFSWNEFKGQTIFNKEYEAEQAVLTEINLYPDPLYARVFQNKWRIILEKFSFNFFALIDPNNYFFGFHPRQIVIENHNLHKFPVAGMIFILTGFYFWKDLRNKRFILVLGVSSLIALSILKIFDLDDLILWLPLGLVFIYGIEVVRRYSRAYKWVAGIFIILTLWQYVRLFIY